MKKYLFSALAMLLGSWTFISCGDEDDNVGAQFQKIPVNPPNCPVAVNPIIMPKEGLVIIYNLYNTEGKQTNEFKYGEDIIFNVEFRNLSDTTIEVAGQRDSDPRLFPTPWYDGAETKAGIFNVFTKDGKFIGYPYVVKATWDQRADLDYTTPIPPKNHEQYGGVEGGIVRWCTPWLGKNYDIFEYGLDYWYHYCKADNKPLPVGEYVSQFNINIGKGATYTVRVEFNVVK